MFMPPSLRKATMARMFKQPRIERVRRNQPSFFARIARRFYDARVAKALDVAHEHKQFHDTVTR